MEDLGTAYEIDCAKAQALLDRFLDDECECSVAESLAAHVAACDHCARIADAERHLRALLRSKCVEQAPSQLRERVLQRMSAMRVTSTTVTRTVATVQDDGQGVVASTTVRTTRVERA